MTDTKPTNWQQNPIDRAGREFKRNMQKIVDSGDGVTRVSVRVGDGREAVVAETGGQSPMLDELDYFQSDEVGSVARNLIDRHAMTLGHINDFAVVYLLRRVEGEIEETTIDALAKAVKAPAIWRDTFGADAAIWVDQRWWERFTEMEREAVVLHELLHVGVNDKGKLKLIEHDVEEFGMVARLYGPWRPSLSRFGKQLDLFTNAAQS